MAIKGRLDELRSRLKETLEEAGTRALAKVAPPAPLAQPGPEPPVVARLMVEIRSDGSHTIARGALEEMTTGEKVAVEARGDSPAQLVSVWLHHPANEFLGGIEHIEDASSWTGA